jgi:hypothetical protein
LNWGDKELDAADKEPNSERFWVGLERPPYAADLVEAAFFVNAFMA